MSLLCKSDPGTKVESLKGGWCVVSVRVRLRAGFMLTLAHLLK